MNHLKFLLAWTPCVAALTLVSGCFETQYPYCEETVTVLDSLDSPTPAGVTAAEIFALIEGERSSELIYAEPGGDAVHVEIEPGGEGSTALTLALTRKSAGGLRWIESEAVYPTGPGPVAEIAVDCRNRIEIDGQLSFASADGVFAELFDVVIEADISPSYESDPDIGGELGVARIRQVFDPAGLMGAFMVISVDPPNPDFVDYELEVHYPLTESAVENDGEIGQPRGYVGGGAQYTSDKYVSYGVMRIATFGGWNND